MKRLSISTVLVALICAAFVHFVEAKGYLASKSIQLPDLVLGMDEAGYKVNHSVYELETGKSYSLKIISSGRKEYALKGNEFFDFIWLRKVEVDGMEIKANGLYELEFENEGKAEIYFVPIKPGSYKLHAEGLEGKGTFTTINVK